MLLFNDSIIFLARSLCTSSWKIIVNVDSLSWYRFLVPIVKGTEIWKNSWKCKFYSFFGYLLNCQISNCNFPVNLQFPNQWNLELCKIRLKSTNLNHRQLYLEWNHEYSTINCCMVTIQLCQIDVQVPDKMLENIQTWLKLLLQWLVEWNSTEKSWFLCNLVFEIVRKQRLAHNLNNHGWKVNPEN